MKCEFVNWEIVFKMFLDDIDLIAETAIEYNCDLVYETNRIICHRTRALCDIVQRHCS